MRATINQFTELAKELDRESWAWLCENHPTIADAVQNSVEKGATSEQVRAFVVRRAGVNRIEFARRCESAARHLGAGK
jgi:hypothetical protein